MGRRKIGLAVSHLRLRRDIRIFIEELAKKADVTVFMSEKEKDFIKGDIKIRCIEEVELSSKTRLTLKTYEVLKKYPNHPQSYIDYAQRKLERSGTKIEIRNHKAKQFIRKVIPYRMDYDFVADVIGRYDPSLDELDLFIGVTDVVSDQLYANIRFMGVPFYVYVASWDHPPKFTRFLRNEVQYLVWGDKMADDLIELHSIDRADIKIFGSMQFEHLAKYLSGNKISKPKQNFIYYIGTFGYPIVLKQELAVLQKMSDILLDIDAGWHIVFRPYPILNDQSVYEVLREKKNIKFDGYNPLSKEVYFNSEDINKKYELIRDASAVFHMGTTMGLEACFFDTPVFCFSGKGFDKVDDSVPQGSRLSKSFNQWHLKKFFKLSEHNSINIISSIEELSNALSLVVNDAVNSDYNDRVSDWIKLEEIDRFVEKIIKLSSRHES